MTGDPPLLHATVVGTLYLELQAEQYGHDLTHYFSADTFNENDPSSDDLGYLAAAASAVYSSMQAVDDQAVWVMQGWLFYKSDFWYPYSRMYIVSVVMSYKLPYNTPNNIYPNTLTFKVPIYVML